MLPVVGFRISKLPLAIAICLFAVTSSARAEPIDDFNDGNDDGWTRLANLGSGGPGIWDASSGKYNLASTGPTGPLNDFIASVWDGSVDPAFSNGFLSAEVRANTETSVAWLAMRFDGVGGIYEFVGSPLTHTFAILRVLPGDIQTLASLDDPAMQFNMGEDWLFEAGTVGNQISFKVWRAGEAEPAAPQMLATDSTFAAGPFGVGGDMRCCRSDGHSDCLIRSVELSMEGSASCRRGRTAGCGVGTTRS